MTSGFESKIFFRFIVDVEKCVTCPYSVVAFAKLRNVENLDFTLTDTGKSSSLVTRLESCPKRLWRFARLLAVTAAPPVVLVERWTNFTFQVYFDICSTSIRRRPLIDLPSRFLATQIGARMADRR